MKTLIAFISFFIIYSSVIAQVVTTLVYPPHGSDFYKELSLSDHLHRVKKMRNNGNIIRETFIERYAPKSITTDADILKRVSKYGTKSGMRYQDIGWFFETYVKNKYSKFNYVKNSRAQRNDLTAKLNDGRFVNAQLKAHKSGNPKTYFKDMLRGYNSTFVIPDDHARKLKQYIKNLIRERSYLEKLSQENKISAQKMERLKKLKSYRLEEKIRRIKGGSITYASLERNFDKGIAQIRKQATLKSSVSSKAVILKSIRVGMNVLNIAYTSYETYNLYQKYDTGAISIQEYHSQLGSNLAGFAGAWMGVKVGAKTGAIIGSSIGNIVPGLGTASGAIIGSAVGTIVGGTTGYFVASTTTGYTIDNCYNLLNKKSTWELEKYINEKFNYHGIHTKVY